MSRTTYRSILKIAATALASVVVLTACGNSGGGSIDVGSGAYVTSPGVATDGKVQLGTVDSSGTAVTGSAVTPSVIRTGDMSLNATDVSATYEKVKTAVSTAGGRVESSNFSLGGNGATPFGTVVARIPEAKLDSALESISALGQRTSLNLNATDVTLTKADLDARITALTASRDRLRDLMAKAKTVADLLAAETELTSRQAELDSLTSQRTALEGQVAESTLTITVTTDRTGITAGLRNWGDLARQGIHSFLTSVQSALVFALAALPWVAAVLLIGWFFAAIRRRIKRRR